MNFLKFMKHRPREESPGTLLLLDANRFLATLASLARHRPFSRFKTAYARLAPKSLIRLSFRKRESAGNGS
jgi:hypothetical protein